MPSTTWYFAYGSNMSKQQMLLRTGATPPSRLAQLEGYRLAFRKYSQTDEVYADILPSAKQIVRGVAYQCSEQAIAKIDVFEGVSLDHYRREMMDIRFEDTKELALAFVYVGSSAFSDLEAHPSQEYLDRILAGTNDHGLDANYIQFITDLAKSKKN